MSRFWLCLSGGFILVGSAGCFLDALQDDFVSTLLFVPCVALFVMGWMVLFTGPIQSWLGLGWRVAAIVLSVPVALFAMLMWPQITYAYRYPGIRLHFLSDLPEYEHRVAKLPNDEKRFATFSWGGLVFASDGITYDETDEVALPEGQQSTDWKKRRMGPYLSCLGIVEPLGNHFYYTSFSC